MDSFAGLSRALDYIEANLTGVLDVEAVARQAHYSPSHFQRMFLALTGLTVGEYARRRRLTLAAQELALEHSLVIDVALKYGYESPEAFGRAFQRMHGLTPSEARQPGVTLKAFPRLSFQLILKGDQPMQYRIFTRPAMTIVGKPLRTTTQGSENLNAIPAFWQRCQADGTLEVLDRMAGPLGTLGVCLEIENAEEAFTYLIAVEKTDAVPPADWMEYVLPAGTWAAFESCGPLPESIQQTWARIFSDWFPASEYEHTGTPDMEVYPPDMCGNDANTRTEVWVPVRKKLKLDG